ncbi:response regulator [bacterium]|nr:MAG: response regulator [bacterium]
MRLLNFYLKNSGLSYNVRMKQNAKFNILLVDNEIAVVKAFQRQLENAGYAVKAFDSGQDAIEAAKLEHFDIAYIDLVMPGLNGVEICRKIKELSPKTEVILISGYPDDIIVKGVGDFIKAGGRDKILRKPLLNNELLEITKELILEIIGKRRD